MKKPSNNNLLSEVSMFTHARYANNSFECSSKGDKRFSAFYARLNDGRSIEEHYQCDVKGYDVGGTNWRLGKGKAPKRSITKEQQWAEYKGLWSTYFKRNPQLLDVIKQSGKTVLTDCFASSPINQARAIAEILNES